MTVSNYIESLLAREVYAFSLQEARQFCNKSETAVKSDIYRLVDKKKLINLRKGFYLILPPRYTSSQKLPVQLYCEKLFSDLNRKYYLSLFTAAKLHGCGHQQIQQDYITTKAPKLKDISKESIRIRFLTSVEIPNLNIDIRQSEGGIYRLSSPALTIVDMIHHHRNIGGINRVLTAILELSEDLAVSDLRNLLGWYTNKSSLQRYAFLLEYFDMRTDLQDIIHSYLGNRPF